MSAAPATVYTGVGCGVGLGPTVVLGLWVGVAVGWTTWVGDGLVMWGGIGVALGAWGEAFWIIVQVAVAVLALSMIMGLLFKLEPDAPPVQLTKM